MLIITVRYGFSHALFSVHPKFGELENDFQSNAGYDFTFSWSNVKNRPSENDWSRWGQISGCRASCAPMMTITKRQLVVLEP